MLEAARLTPGRPTAGADQRPERSIQSGRRQQPGPLRRQQPLVRRRRVEVAVEVAQVELEQAGRVRAVDHRDDAAFARHPHQRPHRLDHAGGEEHVRDGKYPRPRRHRCRPRVDQFVLARGMEWRREVSERTPCRVATNSQQQRPPTCSCVVEEDFVARLQSSPRATTFIPRSCSE